MLLKQAIDIVKRYHTKPNWDSIPDDVIDTAHKTLLSFVESLLKTEHLQKVSIKKKCPSKSGHLGKVDILYNLLQHRPFCECAKKEKDLYSAWCLRIVETLEMRLEEK